MTHHDMDIMIWSDLVDMRRSHWLQFYDSVQSVKSTSNAMFECFECFLSKRVAYQSFPVDFKWRGRKIDLTLGY